MDSYSPGVLPPNEREENMSAQFKGNTHLPGVPFPPFAANHQDGYPYYHNYPNRDMTGSTFGNYGFLPPQMPPLAGMPMLMHGEEHNPMGPMYGYGEPTEQDRGSADEAPPPGFYMHPSGFPTGVPPLFAPSRMPSRPQVPSHPSLRSPASHPLSPPRSASNSPPLSASTPSKSLLLAADLFSTAPASDNAVTTAVEAAPPAVTPSLTSAFASLSVSPLSAPQPSSILDPSAPAFKPAPPTRTLTPHATPFTPIVAPTHTTSAAPQPRQPSSSQAPAGRADREAGNQRVTAAGVRSTLVAAASAPAFVPSYERMRAAHTSVHGDMGGAPGMPAMAGFGFSDPALEYYSAAPPDAYPDSYDLEYAHDYGHDSSFPPEEDAEDAEEDEEDEYYAGEQDPRADGAWGWQPPAAFGVPMYAYDEDEDEDGEPYMQQHYEHPPYPYPPPGYMAPPRLHPGASEFRPRGATVQLTVEKPELVPLRLAVLGNDVSMVRRLISNRIDPSVRFVDGVTPLHLACNSGHHHCALWLLANNADVDFRDREGNTPLTVAAQQGHRHVVKLLAERRVDYSILNDEGMTALDYLYAQGRHDLLRLFGYPLLRDR